MAHKGLQVDALLMKQGAVKLDHYGDTEWDFVQDGMTQ
jgi:hypothetical protein